MLLNAPIIVSGFLVSGQADAARGEVFELKIQSSPCNRPAMSRDQVISSILNHDLRPADRPTAWKSLCFDFPSNPGPDDCMHLFDLIFADLVVKFSD